MQIEAIRKQIWAASHQNTEVVESAKKGISLQRGSIPYWEAVLRRVEELMKPKRARKPKTDPTTDASKARYREAKWEYECKFHPLWVKGNFSGSFFLEPDYPNCAEANGLTDFIVNYINWAGGNATRISSEGKAIVKNGEIIRIPSSTRNGTSDVKSTWRGKPIYWEVKAGKDKPSPAQLKEQIRERRAGGEYLFVHNAEEFFLLLDSLSVQKELF